MPAISQPRHDAAVYINRDNTCQSSPVVDRVQASRLQVIAYEKKYNRPAAGACHLFDIRLYRHAFISISYLLWYTHAGFPSHSGNAAIIRFISCQLEPISLSFCAYILLMIYHL